MELLGASGTKLPADMVPTHGPPVVARIARHPMTGVEPLTSPTCHRWSVCSNSALARMPTIAVAGGASNRHRVTAPVCTLRCEGEIVSRAVNPI